MLIDNTQCAGVTSAGTPCSRKAEPGAQFCGSCAKKARQRLATSNSTLLSAPLTSDQLKLALHTAVAANLDVVQRTHAAYVAMLQLTITNPGHEGVLQLREILDQEGDITGYTRTYTLPDYESKIANASRVLVASIKLATDLTSVTSSTPEAVAAALRADVDSRVLEDLPKTGDQQGNDPFSN